LTYSNGEKTFIKLWPSQLCTSNWEQLQGLKYEGYIYKNIINDIIKITDGKGFVIMKDFVENQELVKFIEKLMTAEKKPTDYNTRESLKKYLTDNLWKICGGEGSIPIVLEDRTQVSYIETYKTQGITLNDFLENMYISNYDKLSTVLDTMKYLNVLNDNKVFHNDLHLGNIFIDQEDGIWEPKIYDYNTSYAVDLGDNPFLTEMDCWVYGKCNDDDKPTKDFIKLLCHLKNFPKNFPFITQDVLKRIIFNDYALERYGELVDKIFSTELISSCNILGDTYNLPIYRDRDGIIDKFEEEVEKMRSIREINKKSTSELWEEAGGLGDSDSEFWEEVGGAEIREKTGGIGGFFSKYLGRLGI
jgi:serine/threonine protein kinase